MIKAFEGDMMCDCLQPGCAYCDQDGSRSMQFEKQLQDSLRIMEAGSILNWFKFACYARDASNRGVKELRIKFTSARSIEIIGGKNKLLLEL